MLEELEDRCLLSGNMAANPRGMANDPPVPVGTTSLFAFRFGPGLKLDFLEVDQTGQVFAVPFLSLLGGPANPTYLNSDPVMDGLTLLSGNIVAHLRGNGGQLYPAEFINH